MLYGGSTQGLGLEGVYTSEKVKDFLKAAVGYRKVLYGLSRFYTVDVVSYWGVGNLFYDSDPKKIWKGSQGSNKQELRCRYRFRPLVLQVCNTLEAETCFCCVRFTGMVQFIDSGESSINGPKIRLAKQKEPKNPGAPPDSRGRYCLDRRRRDGTDHEGGPGGV